MRILLLLLLFSPLLLPAQSKKQRKAMEAQKKADQLVAANIKSHVQYLSGTLKANSDSSEEQAKNYVISQFKAAGLQPKGTDGYGQPFIVDDGKHISVETFLKVNGTQLTVLKDYFPLPYSANKSTAGMPAMSLKERGVPWFADVKDWLEDHDGNAAFNLNEAIQKEAARAAAKGATALFIYNSGSKADSIFFDGKDKSPVASIPLIYIMDEGYKQYFTDHADMLDIELNVALNERKVKGDNVAGYIDNGAATTVLICANYGQAQPQQEKGLKAEQQQDNSVESQSSGVAVLIEVAKMLAASKSKSNNYLFTAFNAEDFNLAGSRYLLQHNPVAAPVNYAIKMSCSATGSGANKIAVQGYSTSPDWQPVFASIVDKSGVSIDSTQLENSSKAFYEKEIPVLSFCNSGGEGQVLDYQTDVQIAKLVYKVVEATDGRSKLAFNRSHLTGNIAATPAETGMVAAKEVENVSYNSSHSSAIVTAAKAAVSLGIIADKTGNADGLKIDGVSPKKLAAKIGLQPGDILTNLGSYKIADMRTYLQALGNFKPGDKTVLLVKRGNEDKEFAIEF